MFRLAAMLYALIGTSLAGSAMVVALIIGQDTLVPLVIAAAIGFAAAFPASYLIAKQIRQYQA